jgi:aspartyl-tRNA(Asn)/glutamyl-tRNA(Gln) amidotransferase subunit C
MSSLSRDDVAKLAGLARIEMSEEELVALSNEFTVILDAVARVQEVAGAELKPLHTHCHFAMYFAQM